MVHLFQTTYPDRSRGSISPCSPWGRTKRTFSSGVLGVIDPRKKNLTAKVHLKYVKCWGVQIKNTRILILFADTFSPLPFFLCVSQTDHLEYYISPCSIHSLESEFLIESSIIHHHHWITCQILLKQMGSYWFYSDSVWSVHLLGGLRHDELACLLSDVSVLTILNPLASQSAVGESIYQRMLVTL